MLKSTNQPLSEAYSLALLDLDGVVYRGKNPVEDAAKNIRKAESLSHGYQNFRTYAAP